MARTGTIPLVAFALGLLAPIGTVRAEGPEFDPGAAVRATAQLLERYHLRSKRLDDERSRKWLATFLARLDPHRMYFRQSDVAEFRRHETRLDDLAKAGDFRFPKAVRGRYRKRVDEAASLAEEFVSAKHDYALDEKYPSSFDTYPASREEMRERWRLRLKAELLIEKAHGRPKPEVQAHLSGRYRRIARQAREMTDERLCDIYLNSLAATYDPHSAYLSPALLTSYEINLARLTTYSFGLRLRQRDGQFLITGLHPALRTPTAERDPVGWNLMAIRRLDGTVFDLVEMHPDDLGTLIRQSGGPLGSDTEVILELVHPATLERLTISWNRFS